MVSSIGHLLHGRLVREIGRGVQAPADLEKPADHLVEQVLVPVCLFCRGGGAGQADQVGFACRCAGLAGQPPMFSGAPMAGFRRRGTHAGRD